MLLSIIIPAYNAEKTILRTLDSLLPLTLMNSLLEVIIVNDGSTDNTIKIVNTFFLKSNFVFKIKSQINLGLSQARNNGLRMANGKYIWFVDSDDQILIKNFTDFKKTMHKDYDVFSFPVIEFGKNKRVINNSFENESRLIGIPYYIFNRNFILDNNLFHLPNLIHEDLELFPRVIEKVTKHLKINFCEYKRIVTPGSLTQSKIKLGRVTSLIDISLLHLKRYNSKNKHYGYYSIIALNNAFRLCFKLNFKDFKLFSGYISEKLSDINLILKIRENNLIKFKSIISIMSFNFFKYLK